MMEGGGIKINDSINLDENTSESANDFLDYINKSKPFILTLLNKLHSISDNTEKITIIDDLINLYNPLSERITVFYNEQKNKRKIDADSANYLNLLHHLKNDITVAPPMLDMMKDDLIDDEDSFENSLKHVEDSISEWETLSNNIMSLEDSNLKIEKVNVDNILKDSIESRRAEATNKNIEIKSDIDSKYEIMADYLQLKTIIDDIIKNAIKFTENGGHINISSERIKEMIEIKIKDDGVGIPESTREILLKGTVNSSVGTAGEKGTGTGLMISSIIIKRMNGDIKIESAGEGRGTTVTITLPEGRE